MVMAPSRQQRQCPADTPGHRGQPAPPGWYRNTAATGDQPAPYLPTNTGRPQQKNPQTRPAPRWEYQHPPPSAQAQRSNPLALPTVKLCDVKYHPKAGQQKSAPVGTPPDRQAPGSPWLVPPLPPHPPQEPHLHPTLLVALLTVRAAHTLSQTRPGIIRPAQPYQAPHSQDGVDRTSTLRPQACAQRLRAILDWVETAATCGPHHQIPVPVPRWDRPTTPTQN